MNEPLGADAQPPEDSTPGAILQRERERRALSVQQAAEDLHLDPWMVEAIEANRFLALGAPVYARGHLRKYATRLGVSPEDIIERYEQLQDRPVETDPIPAALVDPVRPPRRSLKGPVWIMAGLLGAALIAWAAIEFLNFEPRLPRVEPQTPISSETVLPALQAQVERTSTTVEAARSAAAVPTHAASAPAEPAASMANTSIAPTSVAMNGAGAVQGEPIQIRLEFSGESWTEVYDANGTRLMYAMGAPGRVRTLTGIPPLQVTLGSVSAVSMQVNGEAVAIPRREARESSRFIVEPDGNLR